MNEEIANKKLRISDNSQQLLKRLSDDEVFSILQFLQIGEVIMFALTSTSMYKQIESIIRNYEPHVSSQHEQWTISSALLTRREITIDNNEDLAALASLLQERNIVIGQLTDSLNLNGRSYSRKAQLEVQDAIGMLSQIVDEENDQTKHVPVVEIQYKDDAVRTSFQAKEPDYTIELPKKNRDVEIVNGFSLKNASFSFNSCSRMELYTLMSNCMSLESLTLSIKDRGAYRKLKPKTQKTEESDTHPDTIVIPIMTNLKKIVIEACFDHDTAPQFLIDLLALAPNLEELEYVYIKEPDDKFLKYLAKTCPKLTKLYVQGDDSSTPIENQFTDAGILKL